MRSGELHGTTVTATYCLWHFTAY